MGIGYVAAYAFFSLNSVDFITRGRLERAPPNTLPATLDFRAGAAPTFARDGGIAGAEQWGSWAWGKQASLQSRFQGIEPSQPVVLRIHCARVVLGKPEMRVKILVEGRQVGAATLTEGGPAVIETGFPWAADDGILRLDIAMDGGARPSSSGKSNDTRLLGLAISHIEILHSPDSP